MPSFPYLRVPANSVNQSPSLGIAFIVNGVRRPVLALLDTGAAVTTIPTQLRNELNPPMGGEDKISGFTDRRARDAIIYIVDIEIAGLLVRNHPVYWQDNTRTYALVGRDILNDHLLLCDGPQLTFDFS